MNPIPGDPSWGRGRVLGVRNRRRTGTEVADPTLPLRDSFSNRFYRPSAPPAGPSGHTQPTVKTNFYLRIEGQSPLGRRVVREGG